MTTSNGDQASTSPTPSAKPGGFVGFAIIAVILIAIVGLFAYAGGWLSPHALTPAKLVDAFEQPNAPHPGFRRNHAKGVGASGYFDSNGKGAAISKALVFQPGRTPVIGRFALAGGQPFQADAEHTVRSMAIQFTTSDGQQWRTGMNNIPIFPVSNPEAFYELLQATTPDPATGKPDPAKMKAFFERNPESAAAMKVLGAAPVTSGFEDSTFNSLDAFRFIAADGTATPVRWAMVAVQPAVPAASTQPSKDPNFVFDALIASVHQKPLQWHLMVTVAQPGDPTNDASHAWPPDRQQIDVGTLTIDHIESEETSPARDINFDPLVLPDGIAASDDPLLSARSAAYAQSFTRREGEAKQPSAVTPAETGRK